MDSVVVAFISFILLLSIGFELAHHHLKETTPEAFQPILTSLYSELTLLGFIGLLMFTIFKLEILEELSKHLFGEGEEIKELGEQVHMVLFGVMALFLAQAVALARMQKAQTISAREVCPLQEASQPQLHGSTQGPSTPMG